MSNRPSRLETALAYAEFGWAVLPLHHVENGHCSCGDPKCKSPGKHPRTRHGMKDASKDHAIIRAWFAKWPNANIGIATGSISGLVVVDVDGEIGEAKLFALAERGLKLPTTAQVKTGRVGGLHHYLTVSPNAPVASRTDDGLEIKADGSYVVAAGSQHQNGTQYQWITYNVPIAPAPDWLIDYARGGARTDRRFAGKHAVSAELADINSPPAWSEAEEARVRSEYRQDMDVVEQWIDERCDIDPRATVPSSLAYDDYVRWTQREIGWTLTQLRFARTLTGRGFRRDKGTAGQRLIRGLRLKAPAPLAWLPSRVGDHQGSGGSGASEANFTKFFNFFSYKDFCKNPFNAPLPPLTRDKMGAAVFITVYSMFVPTPARWTRLDFDTRV
jgi:hypothetical protein